MIQSMTGYGKATATFGNKKISVEIKTLNSKSLDISAHIIPLYREKEMAIRQAVSKAVVRGKVDINIWIDKDLSVDATPVNGELMALYYSQLRQICGEKGIPEPAEWLPLLLRMPDVLAKSDAEEIADSEWEALKTAVDEALTALISFREQEGRALETKFREKISNISALLKSIEPYESERVAKIRERILEGLKAIPEVDYDKNRLEQELIYYIEKLDISEEKQRLSNHLKYFITTMEEPAGQGKKLGFIAQEMGREINTTGSKSNNADMQNIVVKMKDELEQIKEQVLNVL